MDNIIKCLICNSMYSSMATLKIHQDSVHKEIKFDCQDCGKQFKRKNKLLVHVKIFHKFQKLQCDKCDKEFRTESGKSNHINSVHEISLQILFTSSLVQKQSSAA